MLSPVKVTDLKVRPIISGRDKLASRFSWPLTNPFTSRVSFFRINFSVPQKYQGTLQRSSQMKGHAWKVSTLKCTNVSREDAVACLQQLMTRNSCKTYGFSKAGLRAAIESLHSKECIPTQWLQAETRFR